MNIAIGYRSFWNGVQREDKRFGRGRLESYKENSKA
jgi:hypothetical protein